MITSSPLRPFKAPSSLLSSPLPPLAPVVSGGQEDGLVLDHGQRRGKGAAPQGDSRLHVPGPAVPESGEGVAGLPRRQVC